MIDEAALKGTRYEPVAIDLEYRPPQATIDPNRDAGWVRRVRPLLRARWHAFGIAIAIGVVALVVQVQIPAVLRSGIDDALGDKANRHAGVVVHKQLGGFAVNGQAALLNHDAGAVCDGGCDVVWHRDAGDGAGRCNTSGVKGDLVAGKRDPFRC